MRNHVPPVMHNQFTSMIERNTAIAKIRNMRAQHPNSESLVPNNLLSELPPSPPSHTIALFPILSNSTNPPPSTPNPQTPPRPGPQQTPSPSPALSRLVASARHQQWLFCNHAQADIWQPSHNEVDDLDEKLEIEENVRSAAPNDADADTKGEEGLNAEEIEGQQNEQQIPQPSGETSRAGPQSETRHASENEEMLVKGDDNDDVETIVDNGKEEMGGVLFRCGQRTGGVNEGLKHEEVMDWKSSWEGQHFIVPILAF